MYPLQLQRLLLVVWWWRYAAGVVTSTITHHSSVTKVRTSCDQDNLKVVLEFVKPFRGLAYAKGFMKVCNSSAQDTRQHQSVEPSKIVRLNLSPARCGVAITKSTSTGKLVMSAQVQVQMSAYLQQVDDPTIPVTCQLNQDMFDLKIKKLKTRTGRGMVETGRAWMEVRGSAASSHQPSAPLSVGQHTTLAIYTSLPEGITSQPVDCGVHDGHGSRQSLSDRQGCPTDPSLVPRLRQDVSGTHATWATAFPAFSFPDYQLVHYTCRLRLCKNYCPTVSCDGEYNKTRSSRGFEEGEDEEYMEISDEGNILDVVELYNSIEVTAPNIELGYLRRQLAENADDVAGDADRRVSEGLSDREWCVGSSRLAMGLATVGCLLLAVTLTMGCLLVAHKNGSSSAPILDLASSCCCGPPLCPDHSHQDTRFLVMRPHSPISLWSI